MKVDYSKQEDEQQKQIISIQEALTPRNAAISLGLMLEGKKDSCPTYLIVAESVLSSKDSYDKVYDQVLSRCCRWENNSIEKLEQIKFSLDRYHRLARKRANRK